MILEKFLPRTEFDSYEDFKENYKVNVPEYFNMGFDIVDGWADEDPEKLALVWCDDHGEEKRFTFNDIKKLSNKTANYLSSIGIKKGDVVLMILRRRYEYWICATALHKLGAILIPGSLQLTTKDIVYRANAAKVKAVICIDDDFVVEQVDNAMDKCESLEYKILANGSREGWINYHEAIESFSETLERPTGDAATKSSDIMLVYFTSGTTGMPKMVQHACSYPLGHITTAKYWHKVQENKLHMTVSDSGWAKFGWGKIYGQWVCGATIFTYDMDKFIPLKLLEVIEKYQVTTFCAPPTMFRFMLQEDLSKFDLSCIKHCCTAGEPLNPEVYNRWLEKTGLKIYEGFGQTETTVLLANFEWFEPKIGAMGKPSPLYDIRLIDADGNLCDEGEEGKLVIFGVKDNMPPGLMCGYYKDAERTKAAIGGEWYDTGDVAWRDSDGYYWFVGRDDDVIKCSGYRIGPFEVESAVLTHPACLECAITGAPDPIRGQVVKATIVLKRGFEPSDELVKEIQNHVKHATAPYKYPRVVEFVDELPKTLGGKIKRAQIRHEDSQKAN